MVIREYPEEIRKLMEVYEPYANRIYDGKLENAPTKVIEAFEKVKKVGMGTRTVGTTSRKTGGIFVPIFLRR